MAKGKKVDMEFKAINLAQDMSGVIDAVSKTTDALALKHALDQENAKGRRPIVLEAIAKQGAKLMNNQGEGSEAPSDPFSDVAEELAWKPYEEKGAHVGFEHDLGKGAEAKQNLTKEQRLLMQLDIKEKKHRIADIEELSKVIQTMPSGALAFVWGYLMPQQKEIKEGEKVVVSFKGNRAVLRFCPKCGREVRPDHGHDGVCNHCRFSVVEELIKPYFDRFKKHIPELKLVEID